MQKQSKGGLILAFVVVLIIIGAVFFASDSSPLPSPKGNQDSPNQASELLNRMPQFSDAERLGDDDLSEAQGQGVLAYKAELLARVASDAPLSEDEKAGIGRLMLVEAHLYDFSNEEREAIFDALRR